jgi:hypothetical protein
MCAGKAAVAAFGFLMLEIKLTFKSWGLNVDLLLPSASHVISADTTSALDAHVIISSDILHYC